MSGPVAITVPEHREVTSPKSHVEFKILVSGSVQTFTKWRRYSDFETLHDTLTEETGAAPPCELPPKHAFSLFRTMSDPAMLEERRQGLERYLRTIVAVRDSKWRDTFTFKEFIGTPNVSKPNANAEAAPQFSASSWLDEQQDLLSAARDVRAETVKRDTLAERGDVNGAHTANVHAKTKFKALNVRIGALAAGLAALAAAGMSEGEVQRRTDMVARLSDDCQKLSRIIIAARSARTAAQPESTSQSRAEREELMTGASPKGRAFGRPAARVFGGGHKDEVQETNETRPLDDPGLLQLQQLQIETQDQRLMGLAAILERQKHIGIAISQEIAEQNEILDQFSDEVDRTEKKLDGAKTQMKRLQG